jgi:hypothetical protein
MSDGEGQDRVVDETPNSRFVLEPDVGAELRYRLDGNRLVIVHTEVPDALRGRGTGGRLVRAAVDRAALEGLTVVPLCRYARNWLKGHPDVAATVAIDRAT